MAKFYTGAGDGGSTGTLTGRRLAKDDKLIDAIGCADELNSYIGVCILYLREEKIVSELRRIQNDLFIIGANLASLGYSGVKKPILDEKPLKRLETGVDALSKDLPELRQFVIPGGSAGAAHLHVARSISRRMERAIVTAANQYNLDRSIIAYANRLSSYLFVASLYVNRAESAGERHPTY